MGDGVQTLFCLEELCQSKEVLYTAKEALPKLRAQYEKYKNSGRKKEYETLADMQRCVRSLLDAFPTIIAKLNEYGDAALAKTARRFYEKLRTYDYLGISDHSPLCAALDAFAQQLPDETKNINTAALGHRMNRVRMGYYPTDLTHVEKLRRAVVFPETEVHLIDPCCGEGLALERFAQGENAVTYGVELDVIRREAAQSRLSRVAFGSFFHSRISNNAFQALFLNPPYLSVKADSGTRRLERAFLADSLRLLCSGGLLIYIIPYYCATPEVCRVLCEHFTDLRVYRFIGKEFERYHQVVFLGSKTDRHPALKQAERLTEYMLDADGIPTLDELPEKVYPLPEAHRSVELFKGAVFNVNELAEQLKCSGSLSRLFSEQALDTRTRRPIMPLNLSQIGLVGASGMMNGLVECDSPHIIKGRVVKEKTTKIGGENENGKTEIREITSNKLVFNVLTNSGLISLG